MPKLTINGIEVEVEKGANLIQAAAKAGAAVPHFCYHAGLSVAGNCRMCLVEIEKMPKLQIACATPAADGQVVLTESPRVLKARRSVMEFLLLNHPVDCPICDCSGECALQDYYMLHDGAPSRMELAKNAKCKAVDIGPHVMLDCERCILCSRCVRFTDEVSRSGELGIFGRGSTASIGLVEGARLDNLYSGNVVDICPVGALTDKQFRFTSRPWFLKDTDTVCPHCSRGCNVVLNTNTNLSNKIGDNRAFRVYPRENRDVNGFWMCDEGRYAYPTLDEGRLDQAMYKGTASPMGAALAKAAEGIQAALKQKGPDSVAFLLSPGLTLEELYAFQWLAGKLGLAQVEAGEDLKKTGFADDILIQADKNANSRGARDLGLVGGKALAGRAVLEKIKAGGFQALVAVEQDFDDATFKGLAIKLGTSVLVQSHANTAASLATTALPLAMWGEQDGVYVNFQGRAQLCRKAMEPMGSGLSGWQIAFELGKLLGFEPPASGAEELFGMAAKQAGYACVSYGQLGAQGALTAK